jgi:benzoyl-CoA reductase/2-hydroxyglutaryl-CoA dehydratase subunit BcrC/BadD/HgdB
MAGAEVNARGASLSTLQRYYGDRAFALAQMLEGDRPVAGRIGASVPAELLMAAGFASFMITAPAGAATPTADVYIEPVVPPETRALFQAALNGAYDEVALLVLSRQYDKLFYYLKEIYRLGLGPRLPPLHIYDLMQSQRASVAAYNRKSLGLLTAVLERASGQPIKEAALVSAAALTNRIRGLQRRLIAHRFAGVVGGVEAMQVLGAGVVMAPNLYQETLAAYLDALPAAPSGAWAAKVLVVTSEPLPGLDLHQAIEAASVLVAAEDDVWGARGVGEDIAAKGPPLEALLAKYARDTPTSGLYPPDIRETWFEGMSRRPEVDAVIFYVPPSDRQFGWDYPRLKAGLDARGVASLLIRTDAATPEGAAAITTAVTAFLAGRDAKEPAHV